MHINPPQIGNQSPTEQSTDTVNVCTSSIRGRVWAFLGPMASLLVSHGG